MRMILEGEANDHVGKGMSGGEIVLFPRTSVRVPAGQPVLAGNALLYGATGGRLFVAGRVGERFAVRNSGAIAVVEATGDHACEYMTSGAVAILGETGRNLGAGMSGGVAYVLDEDGRLPYRCNTDMVSLARILSPRDAGQLKSMLEGHRDATGSARAAEILENWKAFQPSFCKLSPKEAASAASLLKPAERRRPAEASRRVAQGGSGRTFA
jgi:glutamate synthase domain-containing protein 3